MNNCVFARSRNAHRLYVWQNGVFLFWMDAKKRWARSDLVQHLYDEAYCKDPDVTPEEWFVDSSDFTILDEYEVPADALAALQEVTLCKNVPTADVAATTATPAAGAKAATSTTPAAVKSCPKAPTSPAGTSAAMSSLSDAETSCSAPAFDYSGLDEQTVNDLHLAERECAAGRRLAEAGLHRMADGVAIAHETLVPNWDNSKHGNRGEDAFRRWCESIGVSKSAAYRLLQVTALFDNSSPEQQKILDSLSPSLLYAAAKPTAPADLVQGVKDGDITTHKQYQKLLKENQLLRADRVNAINAARQAESERDAALADVNGLHAANKKLRSECTEAEKQLDGARQVAEAARLRADKWQKEVEAAKAQPVAAVVDEDEIDRRARQLAADMTAPLQEELDALKAHSATVPDTETDARNAYDSLLLIGRSMKNAWASVKPQLAKLPENTRAGAIDMLNKTLTEIQTEAMKCL
ncbi:hypothetical protein [Gemmiger formicilis]|uniref:hypothetical protein n=1 Tax=Gemmiger formicilis TaxID=745368 RepID=UPI003AB57FB4